LAGGGPGGQHERAAAAARRGLAAAAAFRDAREDTSAAGEGSFAAFQALLLAELEVSLLAAQADTAAALAAAARALAAASGRTPRLKRFLWPLLSATTQVACTATGPGATGELTALAHDVLRQSAEQAASAQPVSPLGRAHAAA
jgi:hypothetical protein